MTENTADIQRWEMVEVFDGIEHVVGHYTDEAKARQSLLAVQLAGRPMIPDDEWDACYYYLRSA